MAHDGQPGRRQQACKGCTIRFEWKALSVRFFDDPGIEISNNRAENAICPFVAGRKNWLFSDSPKGASASAMLYSLVVSAKMNGLNAEDYLIRLFRSPDPVLPFETTWYTTILRGLFQASFSFGLLRGFIGRVLPVFRSLHNLFYTLSEMLITRAFSGREVWMVNPKMICSTKLQYI